MNCNTTHYRANSSSVPGDPTDETTGFRSGHSNWQDLTLDFNGTPLYLKGLRRRMSKAGRTRRVLQGETISYLEHGVWRRPLTSETIGWESYVAYATSAWHSVPYGWSDWLRFRGPPPRVTQLKLHWDGDDDSLDEIELDVSLTYP